MVPTVSWIRSDAVRAVRTRWRESSLMRRCSCRTIPAWIGKRTAAITAIQGLAYTMYPTVPTNMAPWNAGVDTASPKNAPSSSTSPRIMATSCPADVLRKCGRGKRSTRRWSSERSSRSIVSEMYPSVFCLTNLRPPFTSTASRNAPLSRKRAWRFPCLIAALMIRFERSSMTGLMTSPSVKLTASRSSWSLRLRRRM